MARMPRAEIEIDLDVVRRLLLSQHPDLADLTLAMASHGWDNVMVRLGDDLAVRLPRRAVAARLIEHEQAVLPQIRGFVPVPVPAAVRHGRPDDLFPWPWSVVTWLDGTTAAASEPSARDAWSGHLAEILASLHRPAGADAPANPFRGVPLALRTAALEERLASGLIPHAGRLRGVFALGLDAAPHAGPARWIHGDPHPANILCARGRVTALIDFGDVTSGDPATDLATAWLSFTPAGRAVFLDRYSALTGADAATWARARAWAVILASALVSASDDHPAHVRLGRHGLEQALLPKPLGNGGAGLSGRIPPPSS